MPKHSIRKVRSFKKAAAKPAPTAPGKPRRLFGYMKGRMQIKGDIVSPIRVHWTGDSDNI